MGEVEVRLQTDGDLVPTPGDLWLALTKLLNKPQIETGLGVSEKVKVELYPSLKDLARLCDLSYVDYPEIKEELRDDYHIVGCVEHNSFHASVFFREGSPQQNGRHRQIILAFRGTEGFEDGDWEANYQGVMRTQITPQINYACTFTLKVMEIMEETKSFPATQLIISEHSLGGWLAQISTFAAKYLQFGEEKSFKRLGVERCHPHCTVFDSPGARLILDYINCLPHIRKTNHSDPLHLDICNYVMYPNIVNVINPPFGDMVRLSSGQIREAFKRSQDHNTPLAIGSKVHSINFHGIGLFLEALGGNRCVRGKEEKKTQVQTPMNYIAPLCKSKVLKPVNELNSEFSNKIEFYSVEDWPMAVFKGWNTKVDKNVKRARYKVIKIGIVELISGSAMTEYFEWVNQGQGFGENNFRKLEPGEFVFALIRLSEKERKLMQLFERIRHWKENLGKSADKSAVIANTNAAVQYLLSDSFAFRYESTMGSIWFKCEDKLKLLKNCVVFEKQFNLVGGTGQLPDFEVTSLIVQSEWYCDQILTHYKDIQFGCEPPDFGKIPQIYKSNNKDYLRLILLVCIYHKKKGKEGNPLKNVLVLKYEDGCDLNFNLKLPKGIGFIIVDGIDCNISDDDIKGLRGRCVWLRHTDKDSVVNALQDFDPINGILVDCLLSKEIILQNQTLTLRSLIQDDHAKNELIQELKKSPSSVLALCSDKVEIANMPKTVFDMENTYFNIGHPMNMTELMTYYERETVNSRHTVNAFTLVVLSFDGDNYVFQEEVLGMFRKLGHIRFLILPNDCSHPFKEFQRVCKAAERGLVIDWLACSQDPYETQPYQLMYQFTPDFYITREIMKPTLELGGVCKYFKVERKIPCRVGDSIINVELEKNDERVNNSDNEQSLTAVKKHISGKADPKNVTFKYLGNSGYVMRFEYEKVVPENQRSESLDSHCTDVVEGVMFANHDFLVLSDEPGMGKSTSIIQLVNNLVGVADGPEGVAENQTQFKLVMLVELRSLQKLESVKLDNHFMKSFANCIATNLKYNDWSKFILPLIFLSEKVEVMIVGDGYDEMDDDSKSMFRNILIYCRRYTPIKLIVTTRPQHLYCLQSALCVLGHHFVPLKDQDKKIKFLATLWSSAIRCSPNSDDFKLVKEFAKGIIKEAHESLVKEREQFLGVPLQLRILSEIFLPEAREFVYSKGKERTLKDLKLDYSLTDIYQKFINRKQELYILQKMMVHKNSKWLKIQAQLSSHLDGYMYRLAGEAIDFGDDFKSLLMKIYGRRVSKLNESVMDDVLGVGLVFGSGDENKPHFLHRTFAEFYVAKFVMFVIREICFTPEGKSCVDIQPSSSMKQVLLKILDKDRHVVRAFLNGMLKGDKDWSATKQIQNNNKEVSPLNNYRILKDMGLTYLPVTILVDEKQEHLLEFVINICMDSVDEVRVLIKYCRFNLRLLLLPDSTDIRTVFLLVRRHLKLSPQVNFTDIPFLWYRGERERCYSINGSITLCEDHHIRNRVCKCFICRQPITSLSLMPKNKDSFITWLKEIIDSDLWQPLHTEPWLKELLGIEGDSNDNDIREKALRYYMADTPFKFRR